MNKSHSEMRISERGGAGIRLLVFIVAVILLANAGYNFIPIAYRGENFKQEMKAAVLQGVAVPSTYGAPEAVVKSKISNAARVNQLPVEAYIDVKRSNNVVTARVYYMEKVPLLPFGMYDYHYVFDHTVTPGGFMINTN